MKHYLALLAAMILGACQGETDRTAPAPEPSGSSTPVSVPQSAENACQRIEFEGTLLQHCTADPMRHHIRVLLGPEGGAPYRGLGKLAEDRAEKGAPVAFAMNGGMFDDNGRPIGYYVENGRRLTELNTNNGPGNFHMLPNGVFFGTGDKWQVLPADIYRKAIKDRPEFATQSGPMLVIDGKLHPKISDDGESRHIRNGVGVDEAGEAHFVISEQPLSFGKLARFFRDELGVGNALYLDGAVSALWNPAIARIDARAPLGPLIVVEKRAKADETSGTDDSGNAEQAQKAAKSQ